MHILQVLIAILLVAILCASCTSTRALPKQLPETMKAACRLYTSSKPDVIKAREWAKTHWSEIPEDVKPVLLKLDGYLPELDSAGQMLCAASTALESLTSEQRKVNWDDVLSNVLKAVAFAIELKQKGAI